MASKQEQIVAELMNAFGAEKPQEDAATPEPAEMPDDSPVTDESIETAPEQEEAVEEVEEQAEETAEQTAEPAGDTELPATVAELADAIGVEASYLYGIKVPLSGTGEQVTIGEIKDQLQAKDREIQELKSNPVESAEPAAVQTENAQLYQQAKAAQENLEKQWQEFSQSEAWTKMATDEPAKAMLKMQEYQMYQQQIKDALGHAQAGMAEDRKKLISKTVEAIPDWSDSKVMEHERSGLANWLKENGVSPSRINQETDPKMVAVLRNAWKASQKAPVLKPTGIRPLTPKQAAPRVENPKQVVNKIVKAGKSTKAPRGKAAAIAQLLSQSNKR